MIGRIVEVAQDHRHLSAHRGFMLITEGMIEIGQIPLDDIAAVIGNAHGLTYTNNLLVALAERNAAFVLCGANHNPVGMIWPVEGNYTQAGRMDAQLAAGKPTQKRLWQAIIKAKLANQAAVLEARGKPHVPLAALIGKVRSGDPDNIEAQAARRYWGLLFGPDFRRDREAGGINSLLNYGYMVLRAATARAVMAAGLHPTLGLHHANAQNPMRLVDDLMEPFRPLIDYTVADLAEADYREVSPDAKRALVNVLYADLPGSQGVTPIMGWLSRLAVSLAQHFQGEREGLDLPLSPTPLDLAALVGR
jgi:CRISPR-associated protein Cas1